MRLVLVSLLLGIMLVAGFAIVNPVCGGTTTVRFISAVDHLGPENVVNSTFKVALVVEDVVDLYGLDIQVKWNIDYFKCLSCLVTIPISRYPIPIPPSPYAGILYGERLPMPPGYPIVNETMAWIAEASMLPGPTFSGSGTVAVFTFMVLGQPNLPENATFHISIVDSTLAGSSGLPISHVRSDLEIPLYGKAWFNIKVVDVGHPASICYGDFLTVEVYVVNEGDESKTFNLTISLNGTTCFASQVTVENDSSSLMILSKYATGLALGNYAVQAHAQLLVGDSNATDNWFNAGCMAITVVGDVDGDLDVDIVDVVMITSRYSSRQGEPLYNPASDLNSDGAITILDVVMCTNHYGLKYP